MRICVLAIISILITQTEASVAAELRADAVREALLFYASFDTSEHADFARGDRSLYTAESLRREKVVKGLASDVARIDERGKFGKSLYYPKKSQSITFFKGGKNVAYRNKKGYDTTISFWMCLTPDEDLPPGFVDPLQITDKKWNDASIFVDFNKETPRQFRLGVYSDFKFWNPENRKYDEIPDSERPLVSVKKPPFKNDRWTHVAIVLSGMNAPNGKSSATLYLDGVSQGALKQPQRFSWDVEQVVVMLGIYYVGRIDDFAMFDRALPADAVKQLYKMPEGLKRVLK